MANAMDIFNIVMSSDGMKEFQQELARNEKETETYAKQVETLTDELNKCQEEETELKTRLEEARNATDKDTKAITKLETALDKAKTATKQAATNLGTAKSKAEEFSKSVETLKGKPQYSLMQLSKNCMNLIKQLGMLAAVGMTVRKSLEFYEEAEQLGNLADKAGVAVEALQTLSKASGGDYESAASTIANLKENKEEYKKQGITIATKKEITQTTKTINGRIEKVNVEVETTDAEKTLENVAKKMEGLKTEAEKLDLAASLGIDDNTARMLAKGVDNYRESLKKAEKYKLYTKEDIERMRDYRQIQQDIRAGLQSTFGAVYRMLLPAITAVAKVIRKITDWLAEHEGFVKIIAGAIAIVGVIGAIIGAVVLLNGALGALLANPVALTIMAIIAVVAALIAIINDFIVFLQGGDSIIGELLDKWGYDTEALRKDIIAGLQVIKQWFNDFVVSWTDGMRIIAEWCTNVKNAILDWWNSIPEPIKKILAGTLKAGLLLNPMTAMPTAAVMGGQKFMEKYKKNPQNSVPAGSQAAYYNSQSQNATNTKNSKTINNRTTKTTNNITINVPSGNPQAIGKAAKGAIQSLDNGQRV